MDTYYRTRCTVHEMGKWKMRYIQLARTSRFPTRANSSQTTRSENKYRAVQSGQVDRID